MSKITITCNKCGGTGTIESVQAMKAWNDEHECWRDGGIIGQNMDGLLPAHQCAKPGRGYPLGVIWQCGECGKTYRMESARDRGVSADEWVSWSGAAVQTAGEES